jgi:hypothetical protein
LENAAIRKGIQDMILFFAQAFSKSLKMKQRNYINKRPWNADIPFAKRLEGRLSTIITGFCLLIIAYAFWCNSLVNSAIKYLSYLPISAVSESHSMARAEDLRMPQMVIIARFWGCSLAQAFSKSLIGTTLKLHHYCTEIDLEWVRNALGTPREHLEQCNSPWLSQFMHIIS